MKRRGLIIGSAAGLWGSHSLAQPAIGPLRKVPLKAGPQPLQPPSLPPTFDMSFLSATLDPSITWTRSTTATDGTYLDAAGSTYNSFAINIPRISVAKGLLIEGVHANFFTNSDTPITKSLNTSVGNWCFWFIGTGSVTVAANTSVGTGFGVASPNVPLTFNITTTGTTTFTFSGSINRAQLDNGLTPNSYMPSGASTTTRQSDQGTMALGAWFNASEGTQIIDFLQPVLQIGFTLEMPSFYTDTANNLNIRINGTNTFFLPWVGNASPLSLLASGLVANIPQRVGITYRMPRQCAICLNGGVVVSGAANADLPTVNQLKFGNIHVVNVAQDGYTRRIRYYPRAMSQEELRAVCTLP